MDLINSIAEGAGAAVANKLLSKKSKRNNVFIKLFRLIKQLLDDPEKMELRVTVESGTVVAKLKPDKEQKQFIQLNISAFDE